MGDQYEPIDFNAGAPPPPPPPSASPPPAANNAAGDNQYEVPAFGTGGPAPPPPPPPPPPGGGKSNMDVASDSLASHKGRLSAQGDSAKPKKGKLDPNAVKKFKAKKDKSAMEDADSVVSTVKKADDEGGEDFQENKKPPKPGGTSLKCDIIVTVILIAIFAISAGGVVAAVGGLSKGKFGKFKI